MKSAALKKSETVLKEFKEAHGTQDLLKVFLITGATDISKSHEMISRWLKSAVTQEEKEAYCKALRTLELIELKRIELTALAYFIDLGDEDEENKIRNLFPTVDDVLERVRNMYAEAQNKGQGKSYAYNELVATLGEGRARENNESQKLVKAWKEKDITAYIDKMVSEVNSESGKKPESEDKSTGGQIGINTVFNVAIDMAKSGKSAEEIKSHIKDMTLGKSIHADNSDDYLVKDETVFNDYWKRMLEAVVLKTIEDREVPKTKAEKDKALSEAIDKEVKPFLVQMDEDTTQVSLAPAARVLKTLAAKLGVELDLQKAYDKVKELADGLTPNLLERMKKAGKERIPVEKPADTKKETTKETKDESSGSTADVEIYDETHNIRESNKDLWEKVKDFEYLEQVYDKAVELHKANQWKDALSMAIILITEGGTKGKLKASKDAADVLGWNVDQVKDWFTSNVEASLEGENKLKEENKAEDKNLTGDAGTKGIGPVPQAGSIDNTGGKTHVDANSIMTDSSSSKLLKENANYTDKYSFTSVTLPMSGNRAENVSFQVLDATVEQEPEFLGTLSNFTKFIDECRDRLIEKGNDYPLVFNDLKKDLTALYEVSNSELKGIMGSLVNEANKLRKAAKAETEATNVTETTNSTDDDDEPEIVEFGPKGLVVGEKVFDRYKSGKLVELPEGSYTIDHTDGKTYGVIVDVNSIMTEITEIDVKPEKGGEEVSDTPADTPNENKEEVSKEETPEESPLEESPEETKEPEQKQEKEDESSKADTGDLNKSSGEEPSNSSSSYHGFEEILEAKNKLNMDKAIFAKSKEYADEKEARKAIFDIVTKARKDSRYKHAQIRQYKNAQIEEIHSVIDKAITIGLKKEKEAENK